MINFQFPLIHSDLVSVSQLSAHPILNYLLDPDLLLSWVVPAAYFLQAFKLLGRLWFLGKSFGTPKALYRGWMVTILVLTGLLPVPVHLRDVHVTFAKDNPFPLVQIDSAQAESTSLPLAVAFPGQMQMWAAQISANHKEPYQANVFQPPELRSIKTDNWSNSVLLAQMGQFFGFLALGGLAVLCFASETIGKFVSTQSLSVVAAVELTILSSWRFDIKESVVQVALHSPAQFFVTYICAIVTPALILLCLKDLIMIRLKSDSSPSSQSDAADKWVQDKENLLADKENEKKILKDRIKADCSKMWVLTKAKLGNTPLPVQDTLSYRIEALRAFKLISEDLTEDKIKQNLKSFGFDIFEDRFFNEAGALCEPPSKLGCYTHAKSSGVDLEEPIRATPHLPTLSEK